MRSSAALVVVLLFVSPASAGEGDAERVRSVFSEYRSALLAGEGARAAELLSASTYAYYDEMREIALYGEAEEVRSLSIVNQLQVLLLRLRVPPEELASRPPEELIAHAVDHGWIGKKGVLRLEPGEVKASGSAAILEVTVRGKKTVSSFEFARGSEGWRLDLVPTVQESNLAYRRAMQQSGLSEEAFLSAVLESILGEKVEGAAWIPLRERPSP